MKRCTRCVLTENHEDIWFDEQGVCNYCLEFEKTASKRQPVEDREQEFVELLEKSRGKGEYDCLVMMSGGKDSTYALYLLKERYKLNVLGFTFDNGFEHQEAMENVHQAVDALGIDHFYFKPAHLKRLFRFLVQKLEDPSVVCVFCKRAMAAAAWTMAKKHDISLMVSGDTKGQRYLMRKPLAPGSEELYEKSIALVNAHEEFRPFLPIYLDEDLYDSEKMVKDGIRLVSPYHYITWDDQDIIKTLERQVGWKAPVTDYPRDATNCLISLAQVYLSRKEYGFSWYDTEMSTLIRYGEITREQALQRLEIEVDAEAVDLVLSRLDLSGAKLNLA